MAVAGLRIPLARERSCANTDWPMNVIDQSETRIYPTVKR